MPDEEPKGIFKEEEIIIVDHMLDALLPALNDKFDLVWRDLVWRYQPMLMTTLSVTNTRLYHSTCGDNASCIKHWEKEIANSTQDAVDKQKEQVEEEIITMDADIEEETMVHKLMLCKRWKKTRTPESMNNTTWKQRNNKKRKLQEKLSPLMLQYLKNPAKRTKKGTTRQPSNLAGDKKNPRNLKEMRALFRLKKKATLIATKGWTLQGRYLGSRRYPDVREQYIPNANISLNSFSNFFKTLTSHRCLQSI
jgi:hypothetical protein